MLKIDKAILDVNDVICKNIDAFWNVDRGLLSQNILSQVRTLVEYVAIKEHSHGADIDPYNESENKLALREIASRGDMRFLNSFHKMLQKSVSHYTFDKDGSERLMLKYYEHLLKLRKYVKESFGLDILENINDFPLNTDKELLEYYEKIASKIEETKGTNNKLPDGNRFYIQRIKPFFINQKIYYEITFTAALGNVSKFDRVIAFTDLEINSNYAVRFSLHSDSINILDKDMSILIIDDYEVSIRPCELNNLAKIIGIKEKYNVTTNEYRAMMKHLKKTKMSLTELVTNEESYYQKVKTKITTNAQSIKIYKLLDKCREIIQSDKPGKNVLSYLLYRMNNRIIKFQISNEQCEKLSGLYLNYGCIPFDNMPFCSSLCTHNPRIYDLLESISPDGRDHELFARYIKNNTEIEGKLFTPESELEQFENRQDLINTYNSALYYTHTERKLEEFNGNIYIKGYVDASSEIIRRLQGLASSGITLYTASVDSWLKKSAYSIDDPDKEKAMRNMFANSHVALIYGSAGTGKSTLIKHISNFASGYKKIFLANTHPAVDNMRRKVTAGNSEFLTIASFLSERNSKTECEYLFIDECSTVSNSDMLKILKKAKFSLLILVGDIYQIESISFGNWFSIARSFLPSNSIFELVHPFRSQKEELLRVWDRVRNLDEAILEPMVKNGYVARLDKTIFEHNNEDEIVLCLNYDGLYGINNINRFLQNCNPNPGYSWGVYTYKKGDPILFNESNIFSPLIHNNSKGKIHDIKLSEKRIVFEIELEESINELDASSYSFDLVGESENGKSIISFGVSEAQNADDDDDENNSYIVPFQVAYAISIHKAQGLEFESVKIVITREIEERITHNIFYTAITRTKNKLKIYWSPETEQTILDRLVAKNSKNDAFLLAQLSSINLA